MYSAIITRFVVKSFIRTHNFSNLKTSVYPLLKFNAEKKERHYSLSANVLMMTAKKRGGVKHPRCVETMP